MALKSPTTPQGMEEGEEAERRSQKALLRRRVQGAWTAVRRKEILKAGEEMESIKCWREELRWMTELVEEDLASRQMGLWL